MGGGGGALDGWVGEKSNSSYINRSLYVVVSRFGLAVRR